MTAWCSLMVNIFRYFTDSRSPFSHLLEDLDGDLWVATLDGIMRFSLHGLVSYGRNEGLKDPEIDSILEDHESRLYTISPGWIISQLKERTFASVRPNIPPSSRLWTSPLGFLDHTGQWWLLTGGRGLYRFPRVKRFEDLAHTVPKLYTNLDGLPAEWVYCMFEDSHGELWIAVGRTEEGGYRSCPMAACTESFHRFTEADGLPPLRSAASFVEEDAGDLWFGFYEEGLVRYSAGARSTELYSGGRRAAGIHYGPAYRPLQAASGLPPPPADWPGVVMILPAGHPPFVIYTTRQGLSTDNARSLTEDLGWTHPDVRNGARR